jgi:transcriptional regulator with XRE-family HTH domain
MPTPSPTTKDPVLEAFGAAVRKARSDREISQEELAHRCGIDRSYMGAIERGTQNSGLLHLRKIALALDMTLSELMRAAEL